MTRERVAGSVVGPFYVEARCCTQCGVPQGAAPDLFNAEGCYVRKQPDTDAELYAMMNAIRGQEFECIRYAGTDPDLLRRLTENGDAACCDAPTPAVVRIDRNHVSFRLDNAVTAHDVLASLRAFVPTWRATPIVQIDARLASITLAWYQENYHRVEAFASQPPHAWVVRHNCPGCLSQTIDAWLSSVGARDLRWQSEAQWKRDGDWRPKPF